MRSNSSPISMQARRQSRASAESRRGALIPVLFLLPIMAAGCRRVEEPAPRPDVVLITIDTLRSDRVSFNGYSKQTTPFLDELASQGVRFATAYSSSSWTVPGMASLMTGLQPDHHGVQRGLVEEDEIVGQEVLDDRFNLLAESLQEAGYRTFGVSANLHLARQFGFAQGFDHYVNLGFANADRIAPVLEEWRGELRSQTSPYFLWIHYFDPHDPYRPHSSWFENPVPELAGDFTVENPVILRRLYFLNSPDGRRRAPRRLKKELRIAKAAYDAEIHYTDDQIRQAFEVLGLDSDELIVVTSDHGEEFFEHGNLGHGQDLHEEQVRVPLIIRLPGNQHQGLVIEEPVSLVDLAPTVLDLLRIDPLPGVQGRSVWPLIRSQESPANPIFLAVSRAEPGLRAVRQGSWKYIRDLGDPEGDLLFDLGNDPQEQNNLLLEEPAIAGRLSSSLDDFLDSAPVFVPPQLEEVSEETVEELRALGYVD